MAHAIHDVESVTMEECDLDETKVAQPRVESGVMYARIMDMCP